MTRCLDQKCAHVWAAVVKALPEEQMKFALNAALNVLPHNSNLHLWKKKNSPACTLCGGSQTLLHVLNNCTTARDLRRYNSRHDLVLQDVASTIKPHIPATTTMSVDIGEGYQLPCRIVSTDLRPDIVWWDFSNKSVCFIELTVSFETNFVDAAERKTTKYADLVRQARSKGYSREEYLTTRASWHWPECWICLKRSSHPSSPVQPRQPFLVHLKFGVLETAYCNYAFSLF